MIYSLRHYVGKIKLYVHSLPSTWLYIVLTRLSLSLTRSCPFSCLSWVYIVQGDVINTQSSAFLAYVICTWCSMISPEIHKQERRLSGRPWFSWLYSNHGWLLTSTCNSYHNIYPHSKGQLQLNIICSTFILLLLPGGSSTLLPG